MTGSRFLHLAWLAWAPLLLILPLALLLPACAGPPIVHVAPVAPVAPPEPAPAEVSPPAQAWPLFDEEPAIRVLIGQSELPVVVAGVGLSTPRARELGSVTIEVVDGVLTSTGDVCEPERCVFHSPGGVAMGAAGPFPGRLEVLASEGELLTVLEVPIETYLRGVVSAEIPSRWPVEVKMAQAIAARSYALAHLDQPEAHFDVRSDTLDQVYRPGENSGAADAVTRTRGQVLAANGALVEAFYHSTCGGHTENPNDVWPDAPALDWATACTTDTESPRHTWEVRLSNSVVATAHADISHVDALRLESRSGSGRALEITVVDGPTSVTMPAPEFRRAIGTRRLGSTFFEARTDGGTVTFTGRGFGHGVGMCQWGAHGLVAEGNGHREVLAHYYRGTTVMRAYE
ncbi:MAG: SpoIID/LytB domain-containing protein [Deltaproteobacteria bacterium]|nr:SpoIID/LytB domain-containing protein [Deltaproteobacteria bacterium]